MQIVWLIDSTRRVVEVWCPNQPVRTLTNADTLSGEEILPGFKMPVQDLWE